jgi:photosystem II stability/assembly factor-like uncharacterized protein
MKPGMTLIAFGAALCVLEPRAQTWRKITPAMPSQAHPPAYGLTLDGKGVATLYPHGAYLGEPLSGYLYWTGDQGVTWERSDGQLSSVGVAALPDGDLAAVMFRQREIPNYPGTYSTADTWKLMLSSDHGDTWTTILDSLPFVRGQAFPSLYSGPDGNLYLFGNDNGSSIIDRLLVSKDKGRTWSSKGGLTLYSRWAFDPEGNFYCAGSKTGNKAYTLYRSKDAGDSWDSIAATGNKSYEIYTVAANRKGTVAFASDVMRVREPGDTAFRNVTALNSVGEVRQGNTAIASDGGILSAGLYGVNRISKDLSRSDKYDKGMDAKIVDANAQLATDSSGNAYLTAQGSHWILTAEESAVFPVSSRRSPRPLPGLFDALGREWEGLPEGRGDKPARPMPATWYRY